MKFANRVMKLYPSPNVDLTVLATEGTTILTREYGELTDFESGCWAAVLGHGHPQITATIAQNAARLLHHHQFFATEHPGALVAELSEAAGLKQKYKGTFLTSGSEAVSLAVALAEELTGRDKKLSFTISYHGALPGLRLPRNPAQWQDLDITDCLHCQKTCDCRQCGKFAAIDYTALAAFVFEPGNSGGLVLCPPEKLIQYLSQEVRKAGGYIVCNEVTTGFGRTGKWFGFQHYQFDAEPDFIAMGKGLGNGYPVSCLLVREELADKAEASSYKYLQSHTDDPLGCMVARTVVQTITSGDLINRGNWMGEYIRTTLKGVAATTWGVKEVRGRGLMNLLVLADDVRAKSLFVGLLEKGFFTGLSEFHNAIRLYPPMVVRPADVDNLGKALGELLPGKGVPLP